VVWPTNGAISRGQRLRGERPGGHDGDRVVGDARHLLAMDARRAAPRRLGDASREQAAVDGERAAGGHLHLVRDADDQRAHPPHLFLEQPGRLVEGVAAQAVRADELGEVAVWCTGVARTGRIS
jgi:hypothetical protein